MPTLDYWFGDTGRRVTSAEVRDVAKRRIDQLRQLPFNKLAAMPPCTDAGETIRGRHIAVAVWVDRLPDSRVRVVTQAYLHRFLGIGTMAAEGFMVSADGSQADVPEEMMWDFL
jgi:hypothetical protein